MDSVQTEATAGSRLGAVEKDLAVLREKVGNMGGTVDQNESRVDKLRQFMWRAMGIIGCVSMIPIGLAIYNAFPKQ